MKVCGALAQRAIELKRIDGPDSFPQRRKGGKVRRKAVINFFFAPLRFKASNLSGLQIGLACFAKVQSKAADVGYLNTERR